MCEVDSGMGEVDLVICEVDPGMCEVELGMYCTLDLLPVSL